MTTPPKKSVLVTGCSAGGIGAGLAEMFHERGYHVFATARNPSKIPASLSGAASGVTVLMLDVLSAEAIAAAVERVRAETGGRLNVLVNNSGEALMAPALDVSIDRARQIFDLNFWAPFALLQAFAPLLIEARGCLVNNTSANAVVPMPFCSIYNSSKAALASASETWQRELQPLGVRTITLITLAVNTGSFADHEPYDLPEGSRYHDIRDLLRGMTDGRMQEGAILPRQYAAHVVREIERGTSGTVWAGTHASLYRWAWWLSPQPIKDMMIDSIVPAAKEMAKFAEKRKS